MRRRIKVINVIIFLALLVTETGCGPADQTPDTKQVAVVQPKPRSHPDAFYTSHEKLLLSYFTLKDALVDYDTLTANAAAKQLAMLSDSVQVDKRDSDSSSSLNIEALKYADTIKRFSSRFISRTDIQQKKKDFQIISDAIYKLERTVKYDGQRIYQQHCPMAFNDEVGAYWISNSSEIVNPYLGKKHPKYRQSMLGCGEVTDSLN